MPDVASEPGSPSMPAAEPLSPTATQTLNTLINRVVTQLRTPTDEQEPKPSPAAGAFAEFCNQACQTLAAQGFVCERPIFDPTTKASGRRIRLAQWLLFDPATETPMTVSASATLPTPDSWSMRLGVGEVSNERAYTRGAVAVGVLQGPLPRTDGGAEFHYDAARKLRPSPIQEPVSLLSFLQNFALLLEKELSA